MNVDTLVERLLDRRTASQVLQSPLPDEIAKAVVERLKAEADRHWRIDANRSLELADVIIQIGEVRNASGHIALGLMARGDALKLLGRTEEAWSTLGQAGDLFQKGGDEVGWARTRIGRLAMSVDLNHVAEALADAQQARAIFTRHNEHEKRLRLDLNTAAVYTLLGDHRYALTLYHSALATAQALGLAGQDYLGLLYSNMGYVYDFLGDFRQALLYHQHAQAIFSERNETSNMVIADLNIAHIAMAQGHYRHALKLLHQAHALVAGRLPLDAAHVKRPIVECYLLLNRYAEARDLAREVSAEFHAFGAAYEEAHTLLHLATAEAELSNFEAAQAALDRAMPIFTSLGAAWTATTQLRRGRIALQQGNLSIAEREVIAAATSFEKSGQQVNRALAMLLLGQVLLARGNLDAAAQAGLHALRVAQRCNVPGLRYTAHLLLGRVAEAQGKLLRAARRYRAAAGTVERVQRHLTITLRPGFLEDKGEALRTLIALYLRTGQTEHAFQALERAKSHVLLNYLADREQLRWARDDAYSQTLIEELNRLRAEHQWLYRIAHDQSSPQQERPVQIDSRQALAELATRERRMRAITEQLYLRGGNSSVAAQAPVVTLAELKRQLDDDTLLVEFYNDGSKLWAFTLDTQALSVHLLPTTVAEVNRLLAHLQTNIAAALAIGPHAEAAVGLTNFAKRILRRLYTMLIEPLAPDIHNRRRLTIVPYGMLHYLPFHLLYSGTEYLIERFEVVVLPAAGLITQRSPVRSGGALVLAHSSAGRLPQTVAEAHAIQRLFGGQIFCEEAASRAALGAPPTRILHIAAHGEHRLDQPDLSYIQLADGQLFADDLLQQDLSYELVTLSACETGRAKVAAGDELIGLGRGFLYAGAGALLVSLWRVADNVTVRLMEQLYRGLVAGKSKAAALRDTQRTVLAEQPLLHPAFWGAFQLVGDARPLSSVSAARKEYKHAAVTKP